MIQLLQIRQTHYVVMAMLMLMMMLVFIIGFILFYLVSRKKKARNKTKWKQNTDIFLRRAIFFGEEEEEKGPLPVNPKINKWLARPAFRQFLIDELIEARKSLAGSASENLLSLYLQLGLDTDSERKLKHRKWHIKARGIQELALMEQKSRVTRIFRLTNYPVEFVRMEAQLAIVQLFGFAGLRFLDVVTRPISEWQQMKLMAQLPKNSTAPLTGIEKWLASSNDSVILFCLKLAALTHQFELHDRVATCLLHPNRMVRIQAVKCLQDIYNESTGAHIIKPYWLNGKRYQAAVLEALIRIGTENELPFLKKEFLDGDNALKLAAARALVGLGNTGREWLFSGEQKEEYPWNEIIRQVKSETAA